MPEISKKIMYIQRHTQDSQTSKIVPFAKAVNGYASVVIINKDTDCKNV